MTRTSCGCCRASSRTWIVNILLPMVDFIGACFDFLHTVLPTPHLHVSIVGLSGFQERMTSASVVLEFESWRDQAFN